MKSKDILKMLSDEVDKTMPDDKKMLDAITSTPIDKVREVAPTTKTATPKKSFFKTRTFQAICACLVCVAVLTGVLVPILSNGGEPLPNGGAYLDSTYLSIDINPSVDFVVDKKGDIVNVVSRNNDGDVLLSNGFRESLIGKRVNIGVDMVLTQAQKLGYINASNVATEGKVNAVRFTATSDNDSYAKGILENVKTSATAHLRNNGIFMVVVDRQLTPSELLANTNITSIEKLGEAVAEQDGFHYVQNVNKKSDTEILEIFRNEFMSHYVAEQLEDVFEDIDDYLELVEDIEELSNEIYDIEEHEGLPHIGNNIDKMNGFWYYYGKATIENEDIAKIVAKIERKICEFNEELGEDDEDDLFDASRLFESIDLVNTTRGKATLIKMKAMYDVYERADVKTSLESLIEEIETNLAKIDTLLDTINTIFDNVLDNVTTITSGIKTKIDSEIERVSAKADDYYTVCKESIDNAYSKLMTRNENNIGTITPEEYDNMLKEALKGYDDLDDFWEATHN